MDVNIKTSGGTALHEAALCGKLDVVRTLLDAGVDLRLRDAQQNTVLDLLRQFPKHVSQDIFKTIKSKFCWQVSSVGMFHRARNLKHCGFVCRVPECTEE